MADWPDDSGQDEDEVIARAVRAIASDPGREEALRALVEGFGRGIGASAALIAASQDGAGGRVAVRAAWGEDGDHHERFMLSVDENTLAQMFGAGEPRFERLAPHPVWGWDARDRDGSWLLAIPVELDGTASAGLFAAFTRSPDDLDDVLRRAIKFAPLASICLHHVAEVERLEDAARYDPLTDCLSRAAILEALRAEVARARRREHLLCVCYLDLDGFKAVNDAHGHLHGDRVLADVGAALRDATRRYDLVGRVGGDEFIVVMPETAAPAATEAAERLAGAIRAATGGNGRAPVGASFGIAECPPYVTTEKLLAEADGELLAKKRDGYRGPGDSMG